MVGLMNAQFAVKDKTVYVLEVNPRGSRPCRSSARPSVCLLAKLAMKTMIGRTLDDLGFLCPRNRSISPSRKPCFHLTSFPESTCCSVLR